MVAFHMTRQQHNPSLQFVIAALQELDSSEKQWLEVCGQVDKLDKFFPLSAVAISRAREAQAAAIARGATCPVFQSKSAMHACCLAHAWML